MRLSPLFFICFLVFLNSAQVVFSQDNSKASPKQPVVLSKTPESSSSPFPDTEHTRKIFQQTQIEGEAREFIKKGSYQKALGKALEAVAMNTQMAGYRSGVAHFLMREALWLQGRYEEALKDIMFLLEINKGQQSYIDEKLELEAMIKARDTRSLQPIYEHIEYLKKKYKDQLPPNAGAYSDIVASAIIRLYDNIGDQDQGIQFTDGFLERCASGKSCHGSDAREYAYSMKNPYFQVKRAFEQDKKEGFKGCLDAKPGEVCMGRATKALIQSDFFAW